MRNGDTEADVLIFVEDPGAANCIIGLPQALARQGWGVTTYCTGTAVGYLRARRVSFLPLAAQTSPAELLKEISPRLVLAGTAENPFSFGLSLIDAAHTAGVLTAGILDAATNSQLRFRGTTRDPLRFAPQFLLCPDMETQKAFVKLGFPSERIFQTGHPQLDAAVARSQELRAGGRTKLRKHLFPHAAPNARIAVFVAEPSNGQVYQYQKTEAYMLHGRGTSIGRTEIVLEEFLDAVRDRRNYLHLVLRLHPKQDPPELAEYIPEFDQISKSDPPLDIVWASDFAVGLTSTLLYEAAMIGVPTLSVIPCPEEQEWLPSVAKGWTKAVFTRETLKVAVEEILGTAHDGGKREPRIEPSDALLRIAETLHNILLRQVNV